MKKKWVELICVICFAVCLFGCSRQVQEPEEHAEDTKKQDLVQDQDMQDTEGKVRIGITLYSSKNDYMKRFAAAADAYGKEHEVEIDIYDGNFDASRQNRQVDEMIGKQVDGILIVPNDSQKCVIAVEDAVSAGIPIIPVNTRVNSDKITCYVGSDDVQAGELITEEIARALNGSGNVVIIEGPIGQSAQIERIEGIKNVLKKYPDMHVIADKTANWSRTEAQSVMQSWLQTFDHIDAVISENDDMALGAMDAMDALGVPEDSIYIVGIDGMEEGVQAVEEGRMLMTLFQSAEEQCNTALDVMINYLEGEKIEKNYWIPLQEIRKK